MSVRPFRIRSGMPTTAGHLEVSVLFGEGGDAAATKAIIDDGIGAVARLVSFGGVSQATDGMLRIAERISGASTAVWTLEEANVEASVLPMIANIVHTADPSNMAVEELLLNSRFAGGAERQLAWPRSIRPALPYPVVFNYAGRRLTIIVEFSETTSPAQRQFFAEAWETYATVVEAGAYADAKHLPGESYAVADYEYGANALEMVFVFDRFGYDLGSLFDLFRVFKRLHFSTAGVDRIVVS